MLSIIATLLSITGNLLVNKKNRIGFIIWIFPNMFWIYIALNNINYSQAFLFLFYCVLNIDGFIKWGKK